MSAGLMRYQPGLTPSFDEWTDRYESGGWDYLGGVHQLGQYSMLAGYLSYLGAESILDIGCGSGLLRERMDSVPFKRYVGIDPVPAAIERAQGLADERTEFVLGDVSEKELGTFDAVVFNEVLYCVPEPERLLARAHELVSPGGHLLTSNIRHPGDAGLYRMIGERFEEVAAVDVSNDTDRGKRRRRVAVYKRR